MYMINNLMLYGLDPSSEPRPDKDPSKSAASPPSMSSDLMWLIQLDKLWDMAAQNALQHILKKTVCFIIDFITMYSFNPLPPSKTLF